MNTQDKAIGIFVILMVLVVGGGLIWSFNLYMNSPSAVARYSESSHTIIVETRNISDNATVKVVDITGK